MSRKLSNALRRKKNKSSGSDWKFEKNLMFLLPVKNLRQTPGNPPGPDLDTTSNEDSFSFQFEPEDVDENYSQGDTEVETTTGIPKKVVGSITCEKARSSAEH
ncbi:hypothetical protein PoB_004877000 [Plakobranchus ocellatus]|uniref:Uncharacterized protein n=1 Tax=Plakobranchus ocellatus TaxID=259542 RepID=A0AAV4BSL2_9GAST|nr:hypothetical protein PoB_004877000 [Plakobranchus ocellatus]